MSNLSAAFVGLLLAMALLWSIHELATTTEFRDMVEVGR